MTPGLRDRLHLWDGRSFSRANVAACYLTDRHKPGPWPFGYAMGAAPARLRPREDMMDKTAALSKLDTANADGITRLRGELDRLGESLRKAGAELVAAGNEWLARDKAGQP